MAKLVQRTVDTSVDAALDVGSRFSEIPVNEIVDVVIIVSKFCHECGAAHDFRVTSTLNDDESMVYFLARCLDGLLDESEGDNHA